MDRETKKEKISFFKNGVTYIVTAALLLGGSLSSILFFNNNLLSNTYKVVLFGSGLVLEVSLLVFGFLLIKKIRKLIKEF